MKMASLLVLETVGVAIDRSVIRLFFLLKLRLPIIGYNVRKCTSEPSTLFGGIWTAVTYL